MFRGSSSTVVCVKRARCRGAWVGVPSSGGGVLKEWCAAAAGARDLGCEYASLSLYMLQRDRGLVLSAWQVWESPFWACTLVVRPRSKLGLLRRREGRCEVWRRRIAHAGAKSVKGLADGSILTGWACYGSEQPGKVSFGDGAAEGI